MSGAGRPGHRPHDPVNVRGSLVGDDESERLGIEEDRRQALATMGFGAVLALLAVVVLVEGFRLRDNGLPVAAGDAPTLVGGLMLVVGVLLVGSGRRAMGTWEYSDHTTTGEWLRLLALLGVLVGFALLMPLVGYVLATTLLFGGAAVLLGSPYRLRSFAYGWVVAAIAFLAFDVLIGLSLPAGPWGF